MEEKGGGGEAGDGGSVRRGRPCGVSMSDDSSLHRSSSSPRSASGTPRPPPPPPPQAFILASQLRTPPSGHSTAAGPPVLFSRFLARAISAAIAATLTIVGAFTGAVTGVLAGRATNSGFFRGAGLGAVAGAVFSVEVMKASRAYWYSEQSSSSSSMAELIEDLLNGRFIQEQVARAMFRSHSWQVDMAEMTYDEVNDMFALFGPVESRARGTGSNVKLQGSVKVFKEQKPTLRVSKVKSSTTEACFML